MKKYVIAAVLIASLAASGAFAQNVSAGAVNGMTLNGSTGLIVVPDAHVAWEKPKVGVDIGYGFVWGGGQNFDHLPRFSVSLFQKFEVSGLMQMNNGDLQNFVIGGKFQITKSGGTALALGGDFEFYNLAQNRNSAKLYLAATYGGNFFGMPVVTTATIGWQMLNRGSFSSQFIYGMGFSMSLFPETFKNYVYWVTDFANFSYTVTGAMVNASSRGAFNTGIRIRPIKEGRFNLVIDVLGTDLLDDGDRGLSTSISGGLAF
ncbi:MAG: hypothetical protein J7L76_06600 [Spirochaetaceae bacterium]|nr:hypothetical protein [Spirochaetaceae bacterium]